MSIYSDDFENPPYVIGQALNAYVTWTGDTGSYYIDGAHHYSGVQCAYVHSGGATKCVRPAGKDDGNGGNARAQCWMLWTNQTDTYIDIGIMVRNLPSAPITGWATSTGYVLLFSLGSGDSKGIKLMSRVAGTGTAIGTTLSDTLVSPNVWYLPDVEANGNQISGYIQRATDGYWLTPTGWQAAKAPSHGPVTDTSIAAGTNSYAGIFDYSMANDTHYYDGFDWTTLGNTILQDSVRGRGGIQVRTLSSLMFQDNMRAPAGIQARQIVAATGLYPSPSRSGARSGASPASVGTATATVRTAARAADLEAIALADLDSARVAARVGAVEALTVADIQLTRAAARASATELVLISDPVTGGVGPKVSSVDAVFALSQAIVRAGARVTSSEAIGIAEAAIARSGVRAAGNDALLVGAYHLNLKQPIRLVVLTGPSQVEIL